MWGLREDRGLGGQGAELNGTVMVGTGLEAWATPREVCVTKSELDGIPTKQKLSEHGQEPQDGMQHTGESNHITDVKHDLTHRSSSKEAVIWNDVLIR